MQNNSPRDAFNRDVPKAERRAFIVAAENGRLESVRRILDENPDAVHWRDIEPMGGATALINAAAGGHTEVARLLLDRGADVNAIDLHKNSALTFAAFCGMTETAALLVSRGADVFWRDNEDKTPLEWADRKNRPELSALLRRAETARRAQAINGGTTEPLSLPKPLRVRKI